MWTSSLKVPSEINCTKTFFKQMGWYFKYYRQYSKNAEDIKQSFDNILNKVKSGNLQFDTAIEYFHSRQFKGINADLFKKYRVFDDGNFYFIFVICKQCSKNLQCRLWCNKNPKTFMCFYDIWLESK